MVTDNWKLLKYKKRKQKQNIYQTIYAVKNETGIMKKINSKHCLRK